MAAIPCVTPQLRENPLERGEAVHVFVNRIGTVPVPHRLNRSASRASSGVSSEPAARDDFPQAIDIGIERKRRSKLSKTSGMWIGKSNIANLQVAILKDQGEAIQMGGRDVADHRW